MALGSYTLGLIFILLVALLWASSSVLTQYLYNGKSFDSPFLLTYIGVSLFSIWLPIKQITEWLRQRLCEGGVFAVAKANHYYATPPPPPCCEMEPTHDIDTTTNSNTQINNNNEQQVQQLPYQTLHLTDESEGSSSSSAFSSSSAASAATVRSPRPWTKQDHARAALQIAPVWFIANWAYNGSLAYTSITSSTVLASTGSLFTFLFAVLFNDEQFTWMKFYGVLLGVFGSFLTTLQDVDDDGASNGHTNNTTYDHAGDVGDMDQPTRRFLLAAAASSASSCAAGAGQHCSGRLLLGDLLGLISAVGYGGYAVQTRILCPRSEDLYSMQILLGYIGLINMIVLSPIAIYQLLFVDTGITWVVLGFLVIKGLFDNVLSDYLWMRAVVLTNATVATVGLGLTIPLAFASDILLGKSHVLTAGSIFGALSVLTGFVLVNLGNKTNHGTLVPSTEDHDALHPIADERQSAVNHSSDNGTTGEHQRNHQYSHQSISSVI